MSKERDAARRQQELKNKMDEKEQTKEARAEKAERIPVGTNFMQLPWPTDPEGTTMPFKKGVKDTVRRINGDEVKFERFQRALRIAAAYSKEVFEETRIQKERAIQNNLAAKARVKDAQQKLAEQQIRKHEEKIQALKAAYDV